MTATEHLAAALQSFSIERFRLVVAALEMEEAGQVIEAPQYIRVTRPEHLAARLKRSHETLKAARRRRAPSYARADLFALACWIVSHTRSGVAGMSI
jgi:hypothetical protein